MNQQVAQAIVLGRTDFGEADRILTLLTPTQGKLRLLAKGVRRVRSKLAGGIELFSVSTITFVRGRGDIGTLTSARLQTHFGHIVADVERTMAGYAFIQQCDAATEDEPESAYFSLLEQTLAALDDFSVPLAVIRLWFDAQLLRLGGHAPNVRTDTAGRALRADQVYDFRLDAMAFAPVPARGQWRADHIKVLRLALTASQPAQLARVAGAPDLAPALAALVRSMARLHIRSR